MKKKYDWKTIYKIRPKKRSHHMKCPPPPPLPPTPKRHQKTPGDLFRAVVAKLLFQISNLYLILIEMSLNKYPVGQWCSFKHLLTLQSEFHKFDLKLIKQLHTMESKIYTIIVAQIF